MLLNKVEYSKHESVYCFLSVEISLSIHLCGGGGGGGGGGVAIR